MKWNEQLRHERKSRGWTQSSLAEKMGTNTYTVNRWENGYTFPHPFYRQKLTTLLGINFEEREFLQDDPEFDHNTYKQSLLLSEVGQVDHNHNSSQHLLSEVGQVDHNHNSSQHLLSEVGQVDHNHNSSYPLLTPSTQTQVVTSLAQDPQAHEQKTHRAGDHLFLLDIHLQMKSLPALRPFLRFPWRPLLILSMIFLAIMVIIMEVPSVFIRQPSHKSIPVQASYAPLAYSLSIQNTIPSLTPIVRQLQYPFKAVYPQLINRFALDPSSAARNIVTLTLVPDLSSPASIGGTTITLSVAWMQQHPNDIGLLTHELTLLTQAYPAGVSGWFSDGMADYTRYVYC